VGLNHIIETLRTLGIQTPLEAVPSLALGSFEVTRSSWPGPMQRWAMTAKSLTC